MHSHQYKYNVYLDFILMIKKKGKKTNRYERKKNEMSDERLTIYLVAKINNK
jgi:hypothetical protein